MDFRTNGTAEGTILYEYTPNPGAAITFICTTGLAGLAHGVVMVWLRTGYFIPLAIGCIMACFGYYGRYWSSQASQSFGAFVLQSFMLVLAPLFYSATVYMCLSRTVHILRSTSLEIPTALQTIETPVDLRSTNTAPTYKTTTTSGTTPEHKKIKSSRKPRWLSKLFVLADTLCFFIQLAGLGLQATTSASVRKTGRLVLTAGLAIQCIVTACFIAAVWSFRVKLGNRTDTPAFRWKGYFYAQAGAGLLLLIRNIFRCVEYAQGFGGAVARHEVFVYLFDALPMLVLLVVMLIYQPGWLARAVRRSSPPSREKK